jgi:protein-disulfide isomerase
MEEQHNQKQNLLTIPVAIIIAGVLIAGAVIFTSSSSTSSNKTVEAVATEQEKDAEPVVQALESIAPVTSQDHIRGNPDAPVKIVEYSDFECPFCKRFHSDMQQAMDKYGDSGQVAWVYRHFPLDSLHPVKARAEAVASECAAEQGDDEAFWAFADRFFEVTPSNNQTDIETVLPQIASEIGLNVAEFNTCLDSGKFDEHIQSEIDNAIATGGRGTPWSIIITEDGTKYPVNGALPFAQLEQMITAALNQ